LAQRSNNLILCGFKRSGKTTLAKQLAELWGWSYCDTDDLLGQHPAALYRTVGETKFRERERQAIETLLNVKRSVIATGGGTVLNPDNLQLLKKIGAVIYLKWDKSIVKMRMLTAPLPAFLDPEDLDGSFERMFNDRSPVYEQAADQIIEMDRIYGQ
jgi:shikimate kinase